MPPEIRRGARRAVDLSSKGLTATGHLPGREGKLPLVIRPSGPQIDLPQWAAAHRDELTAGLHRYGAVLFRGFDIATPSAFSVAAEAVAAQLYGDYGDLPRDEAADNIFSSTPYPANLPIHFHNESSHMAQWPTRIFFSCQIAAESGGETPLIDCRELYRSLDPAIVEQLETRGLRYVRNFGEGIDVSWQDFFGTSDRAVVEQRCSEADTTCEWLPNGNLRIKQGAAAVRTHPVTGEKVVFNQVLLHHPAAIPESIRTALFELFDPDLLPRNVTYGDGEPIPDSTIEYLMGRYDELAVRFPWEEGDMIMLDNMLVCHGRAPFEGARKILVAMSGIIAA
ncbi:TauD/TfdA family dioxygenase [uncultured Jatrophihabitans sp.]|uniref:TauD/TfdA family dioxygenase n=1 Tax=uncultured Jatrophihabitans sp. TaxID=1610747 RepID=UPI0035C9B08B